MKGKSKKGEQYNFSKQHSAAGIKWKELTPAQSSLEDTLVPSLTGQEKK